MSSIAMSSHTCAPQLPGTERHQVVISLFQERERERKKERERERDGW
jgi:hypothetical protein